jgi:hypothetical protein
MNSNRSAVKTALGATLPGPVHSICSANFPADAFRSDSSDSFAAGDFRIDPAFFAVPAIKDVRAFEIIPSTMF